MSAQDTLRKEEQLYARARIELRDLKENNIL